MRIDLTPFETRQARLLSLLDQRHLPVLVVPKPANIFSLTNFRGSAGVAVFGPPDPILWVDPRYTLQARESARGVEVREERGRLFKAVARWLKKKRLTRVGYEDPHLTCRELRELKDESGGGVRFEPAGGVIEGMRSGKGLGEIDCIPKAGRPTPTGLQEVPRGSPARKREAQPAAGGG